MKVIYNPRCTKCRILNKAFEAHEVTWERVLYLEGNLDQALVEEIFDSYAGNWQELIRTKEKTFKALDVNIKELTREAAITLVTKNPVFLQRPIVLQDGKAIIARDDETVKKLSEKG